MRDLTHAAAFHHRDAIRDAERFGLVMGYIDQRCAGQIAKGRDLGQHARAQMDVQVRERLVQQHDAGFHRQTTRQRDALALPAGELRRPAIAHTIEADSLQCRGNFARQVRSAEFLYTKRKRDVLSDRHVRPKRV